MDKIEIRKNALEARKALSNEEQERLSAKIARNLEQLDLFRNAEKILLYYSRHGEVQTHGFIEKWLDQKKLFLPRLAERDTFIALPFSSFEELEKNRFSIPEPPFSDHAPAKPDLIIVPGVAFDRQGNRIGMGKGYYDRFLADMQDIPKVGLAYSQQVLESLPKEPYDVPINFLVTEDEVIHC